MCPQYFTVCLEQCNFRLSKLFWDCNQNASISIRYIITINYIATIFWNNFIIVDIFESQVSVSMIICSLYVTIKSSSSAFCWRIDCKWTHSWQPVKPTKWICISTSKQSKTVSYTSTTTKEASKPIESSWQGPQCKQCKSSQYTYVGYQIRSDLLLPSE